MSASAQSLDLTTPTSQVLLREVQRCGIACRLSLGCTAGPQRMWPRSLLGGGLPAAKERRRAKAAKAERFKASSVDTASCFETSKACSLLGLMREMSEAPNATGPRHTGFYCRVPHQRTASICVARVCGYLSPGKVSVTCFPRDGAAWVTSAGSSAGCSCLPGSVA